MSRILHVCMSGLVPWLLAAAFCAVACDSARGAEAAKGPQPRKLRVVVFGGHCDDPESAAGGLITLLTRGGHEVICAYATSFRGDRKFFDRPEAEVRQAEATAACKILGATTKFFPYAHEKLVADEKTIKEVSAWFDEVKPDIVITHWPLDTHPNHNITFTLVWQCYKRTGGWSLYFFEVEGGMQTLAFYPELYVDITAVRATKEKACFCHKSQEPEASWWPMHEQMHRDRGVQCGALYAEAYSLVEAKPDCALLPVQFLPKRR
jgi:N-acetylglucosamine malate deacetylase 1